ncbi:hypothetical protein CRV01_04350 [Arcobacter sp. CECT 8983]|uniref:hypothetical protein n=1 Tax=Arcobacter sp. CECT 8983 TaxID=2044508 RepID=UPI00100A7994|nr:hypothetical protein [Arcobacter sp. CECT 8983]RXJ90396.1 hypothetical protein CRV01_04350 [Arcobacter sp. CECT 8983]
MADDENERPIIASPGSIPETLVTNNQTGKVSIEDNRIRLTVEHSKSTFDSKEKTQKAPEKKGK